MTEQEWEEHEYNKQRGRGCPLRLAVLGAIIAAMVTLLKGGRR